MAINFEKYAAKGNEFLHILAEKLGNKEDLSRAGRVLRSLFRSLRNHLTFEESMHLLSQLPMALKGIYVDGWKPGKQAKTVRTLRDFAIEVMKEDGNPAERDFDNEADVINATHAFVDTLQLFVSRDQLEDAFGTLPGELKRTFTSWLSEKQSA